MDVSSDQSLRERLEEAYALLDVIFARAPVGLALFDKELRFARVNDRLAAMHGVPASEHIGRRVREVLPGMPPDVEDDLRRVLVTGEPLIEVEVSGETPARPGRKREWLSSYWPVRPGDGERITGIGTVVFEVTERRIARRALRAQADRYEALLAALSEAGEGLVVVEEDGRCVYANAAFEQISGYTFPELAARESLYELLPPDERERAVERARTRAEQGWIAPAYDVGLRRRDGAIVRLEVAGVPLESDAGRQLVLLVRDVTARRRADAERERLLGRAALMSHASELLDRPLDEDTTIDSFARLCVRELADTCLVLVGTGPHAIRRVAAAARKPDVERALLELQLRYPLADDPHHPVLDVLRAGRTRVVSDVGLEELQARAVDDRHLELMRALPIGAAVIVPLRSRGRRCGVLALGFDHLEPDGRDVLVADAEDLGRRAGVALETARLQEERASVARTLQRSLLPPALPAIPGVQIAARYRAAGDGEDVGGDFYDCFATGDGEWALVVGDVSGRGAEAAAVAGLARCTMRAAVMEDRRPAAVLRELNATMLGDGGDFGVCAAVYVALRPRADGADARLAVGGHPLPLLVRADGGVEATGDTGTVLGAVADPALGEASVRLAAGDALVLFTDGVVEPAPAGSALTVERLAELLGRCAGRNAEEIADAVERRALAAQSGHPRDDLAVVVLRPV